MLYQQNLKQADRIRDPQGRIKAIWLLDKLHELIDFHWTLWFSRINLITRSNLNYFQSLYLASVHM